LSESVREQLSSLLSVENLESFDTAMGLLFEARINTKVFSYLRVTRKSLHRQASRYVKQLKHDAAKAKKQGNRDIKRIKNDCSECIRTYGARLKEAFDGLNLLEYEIKKSFKWFAHRRDVYNKTGRYKGLVSVDSVKNYSMRKRALAAKEIKHIMQASCVLESLSKAYERARLALTVGGDV
jgi:proline dehydrogenase